MIDTRFISSLSNGRVASALTSAMPLTSQSFLAKIGSTAGDLAKLVAIFQTLEPLLFDAFELPRRSVLGRNARAQLLDHAHSYARLRVLRDVYMGMRDNNIGMMKKKGNIHPGAPKQPPHQKAPTSKPKGAVLQSHHAAQLLLKTLQNIATTYHKYWTKWNNQTVNKLPSAKEQSPLNMAWTRANQVLSQISEPSTLAQAQQVFGDISTYWQMITQAWSNATGISPQQQAAAAQTQTAISQSNAASVDLTPVTVASSGQQGALSQGTVGVAIPDPSTEGSLASLSSAFGQTEELEPPDRKSVV